MNDTYRHKGLRIRLVQEIVQKGIKDERVLNAIGTIPRHLFFESSFMQFAYQDKAFPISAGQTISQPYTVAFQTQLLNAKPGDKVLEVGTGSGYQAAVLYALGLKVFTIERQKELYEKTRVFLPKIGYRPMFFYGDGYLGLPKYGPFDHIIITAGAPYIPEELLTQLVVGGNMIIPVGEDTQKMIRITRVTDKEFEQEEFGNFAFVPMLKGVVDNK